MLDPALFRDPASDVEVRLGQRGGDLRGLVEQLRRLDTERREIIPALEAARHAKKAIGAQIGKAKREGLPADEQRCVWRVASRSESRDASRLCVPLESNLAAAAARSRRPTYARGLAASRCSSGGIPGGRLRRPSASPSAP